MANSIRYRNPFELKPHPVLAGIPEWADDDPEFEAFVEDIHENGILQPLHVTTDGLIGEGRHRNRVAKRLQFSEVPVVEVSDEECLRLAMSSLFRRRHYSKGARAYIYVKYVQRDLEDAKRRRLENLRKSLIKPNRTQSGSGKLTAVVVGERLGISDKYIRQAYEIHKAFDADPDLKAEWEPKILVEGKGLGGVLAGIAGKNATQGPGKTVAAQLDLFDEGLDQVSKRFRYFESFEEPELREARKSVRRAVAAMPAGLRAEFKRELQRAEKESGEKG